MLVAKHALVRTGTLWKKDWYVYVFHIRKRVDAGFRYQDIQLIFIDIRLIFIVFLNNLPLHSKSCKSFNFVKTRFRQKILQAACTPPLSIDPARLPIVHREQQT